MHSLDSTIFVFNSIAHLRVDREPRIEEGGLERNTNVLITKTNFLDQLLPQTAC